MRQALELSSIPTERCWSGSGLGFGFGFGLGLGVGLVANPFTWRHSLWMTFPALSFKNCMEIESGASAGAKAAAPWNADSIFRLNRKGS